MGSEIVVPTDVVFHFWKDFDLDSLRTSLDEKGLEIAANQDGSLKSRKRLADFTKDFKKQCDADIFKAVAPLLKKYQLEVDALTTRSKQAEAAFMDVFKKLQDAPDPSPAVGISLDAASKIAALESKNAKVSAELEEYKQESKELKNQDLTIRRLEEKIRDLESTIEEKDSEIDAAKASAAAELEARSADEARAREERLEAELSRAEAALETMKRLHASTQSQLLVVQERGEEAAAAARSESELAMAEVERAEQQLAALSRERDILLQKVKEPDQESGNNVPSKSTDELKAMRDEIKTQRDISLKLRDELDTIALKHQKEKETLESKISGLQASLATKEAHAAALEAQLSGRPSQEELQNARQQIRMLKAILQNSATDEDDVAEGENARRSEDEGLKISSMEAALLEKNQKLESNLTLVRMQLQEAKESFETTSTKLQELEEDFQKKNLLIERLEQDLEHATRLATDEQEDSTETPGIPRTSSGFSGSNEDSRAMIIALGAQRDRLKLRVAQLEGEISGLQIELDHAKESAKSAKSDNLLLVERLKFVEGYIGRGMKPAASDIEKGRGAVEKYMKEYENTMNPFTDFRAREKEARRRKLPIHDRAAYAVGSAFVSGNRMARSAIVIYALVLHFIAFIVIAGFSHRHSEKMDALEELCKDYNLNHGGTQVGVDPVVGGSVA